jgi:hypothetical protein
MIRSMTMSLRDYSVKSGLVSQWPRALHRTPLVMAALGLLALAPQAAAAPPPIPVLADSELGDALTQAVQNLGPNAPHIDVVPSASAVACAPTTGSTPRLALLARQALRPELDRCGQTSGAEVSTVQMGRQAVALVVPVSSPVWPLDSATVFRALGMHSGEAPHSWNELNPAYPKLPVSLLLPPPNSTAGYLFGRLVMEPGCDHVADARAPFGQRDRLTWCGALRSDIQLPQRQGGAKDVAKWAATAPAGQAAIVSVAELRQLDRDVVPLPLDGTLPTGTNIANGQYPAAQDVSLLIVVPSSADAAQRAAARDVAFDLLAEASIGPNGDLAPAGLIPLPPTERIAVRSQAVASLEQP